MSKLAIFLCVVLFASAANASHWSDAVKALQQKVRDTVEGAIQQIKHITESIKIQIHKVAGLLHKTTELVKKVENAIMGIFEKFGDEIAHLKEEAENANATECTKMLTHLEYTGLAIIANMSHCVSDKYKTGTGYIDHIVKISEDTLVNLNELKNVAFHCGDNVHDFKSAAAAIVCVNGALFKATMISVKVIPAVRADFSKLTELLETLEPSLAHCTADNGLNTFFEETPTILAKTRKCIREKIHKTRDAVPEIDSDYRQE